jgi:hypothetical protein
MAQQKSYLPDTGGSQFAQSLRERSTVRPASGPQRALSRTPRQVQSNSNHHPNLGRDRDGLSVLGRVLGRGGLDGRHLQAKT